MHVGTQAALFSANHQRHLGVNLQAAHAVNHVRPGPLQLPRPADVALLVETGLEFDQCHDLFAVLGGGPECAQQPPVVSGAVERLLDRQHVRVGGGGLQKGQYPSEAVVGVVQQLITALQLGKHPVLVLVGLAHVAGNVRREHREAQLGPLSGHVLGRKAHQVGSSQRAFELEHVLIVELQVPGQKGEQGGWHLARDLQPHHRAEPAPPQPVLDGRQQVLSLVLVELVVGVAGHPEAVGRHHLAAPEQFVQVLGDHVFKQQVRLTDHHETR